MVSQEIIIWIVSRFENQQFNNNVGHAIGRYNPVGTDYYSGYLSNFYQIDGLYLGPEYFGFVDPLTNAWRPKKFKAVGTTVNDGTDWSANYLETFSTIDSI